MFYKTCTKCGIEKGETEFAKNSQKSDGLRSMCIACEKAKYRAKVLGAKSCSFNMTESEYMDCSEHLEQLKNKFACRR